MPHNLRRAFVTEHHIDISVFPQRCFQSYSTVSIGPFYVEMVEVTTRHSGCQQQHLMRRWNWVISSLPMDRASSCSSTKEALQPQVFGQSLQKSSVLELKCLFRNVLPVMFSFKWLPVWASGTPRPWFPGFTWRRWTAAPAGGWPRSRVFWRCRSSRCRWAGGGWASPLAAASQGGAPQSGPSDRSSPSPDAPIPGQRYIVQIYSSTSTLLILYHFRKMIWDPWL